MVTPELIEYIRAEIAKGRTREALSSDLITHGGWDQNDLSEAFKQIVPMQKVVAPPVPKPAPTVEPKVQNFSAPASAPATTTFTPKEPPRETPRGSQAAEAFNPIIIPENKSAPEPVSARQGTATDPAYQSMDFSSTKSSNTPPLPSVIKFMTILLIVGGLGTLYWFSRDQVGNLFRSQVEDISESTNPVVDYTQETPEEFVAREVSGNVGDLIAFSIPPNSAVSGVVEFTGTVQGGYFFEGNIGINILDANKQILNQGNATATDDWMTVGPVSFKGIIDFTGLASGPAYIEIQNDDPSDLDEPGHSSKSIYIPVEIN